MRGKLARFRQQFFSIVLALFLLGLSSAQQLQSKPLDIEKPSYCLGELALIKIGGEELEVSVISPYGLYQTLAPAFNQLRFYPSNVGNYSIIASNVNGEIITSANFSVKDCTDPQNPVMPNTFSSPLVIHRIGGEGGNLIYRANLLNPGLELVFFGVKNGAEFESALPRRIEPVENSRVRIAGQRAVQSFAIDPSQLEFDYAEIKKIAVGSALYKCTDYDFESQNCYGDFVFQQYLTPGEEYTIILTKEDPLYSETQPDYYIRCYDVKSTGSGAGQQATASCFNFSVVRIPVPNGAINGYIKAMQYNVSVTITLSGGGTRISASHNARLDRDQTQNNGNESRIGSSTSTSSFTAMWLNSSMLSSGASSFSRSTCPTWNQGYCDWYVFISSSFTFGGSNKQGSTQMIVNWINYTWNYTVSAISVTLNRPPDSSYFNRSQINFNFTPKSSTSFVNCSLFTNQSGWSAKNTSTSITNNTPNIIPYTFPSQGTYLWNVKCTDNSGASAFDIANRTITLDWTKPNVRLMSPSNGATITSSNLIEFIYNVSDANNIQNCSLIIDGSVRSTDTTITRNTPQSFTYILANGNYTWAVRCSDAAGNTNTSATRQLTVAIPPTAWTGRWFETSTSSYTVPAEIGLAMSTDGTANWIATTVNPSSQLTLAYAYSSIIGNNGGLILAGTPINFRAYFTSAGGSQVYGMWQLYIKNATSSTLVCQASTSSALSNNAYGSASCTPSSTRRVLPTEMIELRVIADNRHPSAARTPNHTIDHQDSYVNITGWRNLGFATVNLWKPLTNLTISQGQNFTLACNVSCRYGLCINTRVFAQINASSTTWANIGSTGRIVLNGSSNPHTLGNITGNYSVSFNLRGNTASNNLVRCFVNSTYSSSASPTSRRVSVQAYAPPTVNLSSPTHGSWLGYGSNIVLRFVAYDSSALANCSLFLNGKYNTTKYTAQLVNGGTSNFTLASLNDGAYNWSVRCYDDSGLNASSATWGFYVDTVAPTVQLHNPSNGAVSDYFTQLFNFTASDLMATQIYCNLTLDGKVERSNIAANNSIPTTLTISNIKIGKHWWNVTCWDNAKKKQTSETWSFNITDNPPTVQLLSPAPNTWLNYSNPVLYFNASDNDGFQSCTLILNNQPNATKPGTGIINRGISNFTLSGLSDGTYSWTVNCTDTGNFTAQPSSRTFYVDTTKPWISLSSPGINAQLSSTPVNFVFIPYDNLASQLTCTLYLDGTAVGSPVTASHGVSKTISVPSVKDGLHSWNVSCRDLAYNANSSSTRSFNMSKLPSLTQNSPAPAAFTLADVTFYFTISDNDGFSNCTLFIDNIPNATKPGSQLVNNAMNNISVYGIPQGYHNWSVGCYDNGSYFNYYKTGNRAFTVDTTKPYIILNAPNDGGSVNQSYVMFNFTAFDNLANTLTCSIWVSNGKNATGLTATKGLPYTKTLYNFINGVYYWNVTCSDQAGLYNTSPTQKFNVSVPPTVTLVSPDYEPYWDPTGEAYFEYLPSSNGNLSNCSLLINGEVLATNSSPKNNEINSFMVSLGEGRYNWTVGCYDIDGLYGEARAMKYYVDLTNPWIELIFPGQGENVSSNFVNYRFIARDNMADLLICNLSLDEGEGFYVDVPNLNASQGKEFNTTRLYPDGNYAWRVQCLDQSGRGNISLIHNFTIEAPPLVRLVSPPNYTWRGASTINLTYYAYDPFLLRNCTLIVDGQPRNYHTEPTNGGNNIFTATGLSDGLHNWTVSCIDADYNSYAPSVGWFYIDTTPPWVVLNSPVPNANFSVTTITLNFTPYDSLSPWLLCRAKVDGVYSAWVNASPGQPRTLSVSAPTEAPHYWNVSCTDKVGYSNTSETRVFNVYIPPRVQLISPAAGYWTKNSSVFFTFSIYDDTGIENCSILLNGTIRATKSGAELTNKATNNFTLGGLDGRYSWSVLCYDNTTFHLSNQTAGRQLNVDLYNPVPSIETPNNSWFKTLTPSIQFRITDNMAPTAYYRFYVNGSPNRNGSVSTGYSTSANLNSVSEGRHILVLQATDLAGNSANSSGVNITVDITPPSIVLNYPKHNNLSDSVYVDFNFTATDNYAPTLNCSLRLDGKTVTSSTANNGEPHIISRTVSPGIHWWNISCKDLAGNTNTSLTFNFTAPAPDLVIKPEWIRITPENPEEKAPTIINATIANLGSASANNAVVQFFSGMPGSGGVQINGNRSLNLSVGENKSVWVNWSPGIGLHNIFVLVDPPIPLNGSIIEENESNNIANTSVMVSGWQTIVGNISGDLGLADASYNLTFLWGGASGNNSKVYAAHSGSNINWRQLQALGRNSAGGQGSNDFDELDTALGTSGLVDSVKKVFTQGGVPKATQNLTIFGKEVEHVPVINSTNSSSFKTGLLWDAGDGGSEYNGSQDIVFVAPCSPHTTGAYGTYDFELKIPAYLRRYIMPESSVALYLELLP